MGNEFERSLLFTFCAWFEDPKLGVYRPLL